MKNKIIFISFVFILVNCKTTNIVKKDILKNDNEKIIKANDYQDDFVTTETIKNYDLTILKGASYPEILNDSPFTNIELQILNNSEGLELEADIEVAHYFKYFLRDKKDLLKVWIDNSRPYIPTIKKQFIEADLPLDLIYLPFLESGYNARAYSRVGAAGVWQFMPNTARSYGLRVNWWIDERRSPQLATPYAIKHLVYLNNLFDNWYTALAAYNAGEGRISRAMEKVNIYDYFELIKTKALPRETRKYVHQYLAIVKIMKNLELLGFKPINWELENNIEYLEIPGGTDLVELSSLISYSWNDFMKLNPAFRRQVNDPSYTSTISIPRDKSEYVKVYLSKIKEKTNNGYDYYYVQNGDTWWYLSKLTNKSITNLKRLNNISTNNLKIGQKLLLPKSTYEPIQTKVTKNNKELQKYTIKNGDTISSISIKYNIKLSSLYSENNLSSSSILRIGQIIKLPGYPISNITVANKLSEKNNSPNLYTVKSGDSIWLIAQKTKIPYQQLLSKNQLNRNSKLKIGDKIILY